MVVFLMILAGTVDEEAAAPVNFSLWATMEYVSQQKLLLVFSAAMLLINLIFASIDIGMPYLLVKYFANHTMMIGVVEVAVPVGLILASILYPAFAYKGAFYRVVFGSWLGFAVVMFLLGVVVDTLHNSFLLFASALTLITLLLGVFISVGKIPLMGYFQTKIPTRQQGRVFSLLDAVVQVTTPVGTVIYGVLFDRLNAANIFIVSGILMAVSLVVMYLGSRGTLRGTVAEGTPHEARLSE